MPKESAWTASNFWAQTQGLYRRPGYEYFGGAAGTGNNLNVFDLITYFDSSGPQETVVIDSDNLYTMTYSSFSQKQSTYAVGSGEVDGTLNGSTLTATTSLWATDASNVNPGDRLILDSDSSMTNPGPHTYYIGTVTDDTTLELVDSDGVEIDFPETFTNEDYVIQRCWVTNFPYYVDWIVADNTVLFAENGREPWSWNGSAWGAYAITENSVAKYWQATCIGYQGDRIWMGDILDGANRYRQRIKWSEVTTHTEFPAANYVDLPYTAGSILRLIPMDDWLIAYLDDAVYVGRPTNMTALPYSFKMIETLESGLVGMKAVCKAHGGHYFVTKDNIWKFSITGLEPIGTPIAKEALENCKRPYAIWAAPDVPHHRVCFAIPGSGDTFEKIWSYDYQSKAWSYEVIEGSSLSFRGVTFAYGWDDIESAISAANWDTGMDDFPSWDAIGTTTVAGELYVGTAAGRVQRLTDDGTTDPESQGIEAVFETPDFDLGEPNDEKIFERISLKIDTFLASNLTFRVEFSNNRGRTWKTIANPAAGTQMTIEAGEDEGYVSFKGRGSTARFKFTSSTACEPYSIVEWVLTYVSAGPEWRTDPQTAT
jgi:hypothetical protein